MALKFTQDNFETEVIKSETLAVVDFYADWCGPCKMMAPVVDELAAAYEGQVKIGKLNVDENGDIAASFRVMSIPTIIFFKNGKAVDTVVGAVDKETLVKKIEALKN